MLFLGMVDMCSVVGYICCEHVVKIAKVIMGITETSDNLSNAKTHYINQK
jgi:hypothetical protein